MIKLKITWFGQFFAITAVGVSLFSGTYATAQAPAPGVLRPSDAAPAAPVRNTPAEMAAARDDAAARPTAAAAAEKGDEAAPTAPIAAPDNVPLAGAGALGGVVEQVITPPARKPSGKMADFIMFSESPLNMVLEAYSGETGRTLLLAPGLPKINITLLSERETMTHEEYILAIQTLLSMNGVGLIDVGEGFVKVVPSKDINVSGIDIAKGKSKYYEHEDGRHVRRMIELKHIDIDEAKKAVEGFKSPTGQIQLFERTNSILVMDTDANVNRMIQVIEYIDQPFVRREEANVRQIKFAKAASIKKTIDQIVAEAKKAEGAQKPKQTVTSRSSGSPGMIRGTTVPGVIRAPRGITTTTTSSPTISALMEEAARGIIRGEVQTIADERTNILIIITRPENMKFFDSIIDVLDIETLPDVVVEVFRMEYADAEEVSSMLNELIGKQGKQDSVNVSARKDAGEGKSAPLSEFVRPTRIATTGSAKSTSDKQGNLGQLDSENIKILADKRTNALVVMASRSDLATIREIVSDMDIMLSQVLVEAVILEISLSDDIAAGIDWIQRSRVAYNGGEPAMAYAGSSGSGLSRPVPALSFNTAGDFPNPISTGLSYYLTFFDFNVDMAIRAAKNDSNTEIYSTPVIMTQDNKEATLKATRQVYVYKGKRYMGDANGSPIYEDDVERQDVGLVLTVTPRINEKGFVVMTVAQSVENVSGVQVVNGSDWPIITKRELSADIAVQSGETIAMGGLVLNQTTETTKKVPFLGSIPLLGWLFKSYGEEDSRNEVVVFLTPYVLNTPEALRSEAIKRRDAVSMSEMDDAGWSGSNVVGMRDELDKDAEKKGEDDSSDAGDTVAP